MGNPRSRIKTKEVGSPTNQVLGGVPGMKHAVSGTKITAIKAALYSFWQLEVPCVSAQSS